MSRSLIAATILMAGCMNSERFTPEGTRKYSIAGACEAIERSPSHAQIVIDRSLGNSTVEIPERVLLSEGATEWLALRAGLDRDQDESGSVRLSAEPPVILEVEPLSLKELSEIVAKQTGRSVKIDEGLDADARVPMSFHSIWLWTDLVDVVARQHGFRMRLSGDLKTAWIERPSSKNTTRVYRFPLSPEAHYHGAARKLSSSTNWRDYKNPPWHDGAETNLAFPCCPVCESPELLIYEDLRRMVHRSGGTAELCPDEEKLIITGSETDHLRAKALLNAYAIP